VLVTRRNGKEKEEMPRIARLKVKGEPPVYHVMSRTALDGFVLGDVEKEYLLDFIKRLSRRTEKGTGKKCCTSG
jgi:hypothetical protein